MRAWRINELGLPWEVLVGEDVPEPSLVSDSLRISVSATDLNFADILQCQGRYQVRVDPPFTPGMSAAGVVLETSGATAIQVGQKVVGPTLAGTGGFAEQAVILADQATVVPDDADLVKGVAMHVTYGTAWFGLHHRGRLQPGESVLVLAAAGGVGSAAVELAKLHGCFVIAAAGGADKVAACERLGSDQVIDYNTDDLYDRVMSFTDGRGVDVVYDPVGGEYFDVARRVVAWEGRYLIIGFASGDIPSAPLNHALVKNYDLVGVHMGGYRGRDPVPFQHCYEVLYDLLGQHQIHPLIDRVVGFDDLPQALQDLAERRSIGRLVFQPE